MLLFLNVLLVCHHLENFLTPKNKNSSDLFINTNSNSQDNFANLIWEIRNIPVLNHYATSHKETVQ